MTIYDDMFRDNKCEFFYLPKSSPTDHTRLTDGCIQNDVDNMQKTLS